MTLTFFLVLVHLAFDHPNPIVKTKNTKIINPIV